MIRGVRTPSRTDFTSFPTARGLPGRVGDPGVLYFRKLVPKIKKVDWLNALDADLLRDVGGASSLTLPPDWFIRQPLGDSGLLIQVGTSPKSGISNARGNPSHRP